MLLYKFFTFHLQLYFSSFQISWQFSGYTEICGLFMLAILSGSRNGLGLLYSVRNDKWGVLRSSHLSVFPEFADVFPVI